MGAEAIKKLLEYKNQLMDEIRLEVDTSKIEKAELQIKQIDEAIERLRINADESLVKNLIDINELKNIENMENASEKLKESVEKIGNAFDKLKLNTEKFIEKAKQKGLKVIFGTPTATMPAWLANKHPEVLSEDEFRRNESDYYQ